LVRTYISKNDIFFNLVGEGPVVMLLHASPLSSNSVLPLANLLAKNFTVICPDTPGYGESPKLKKDNPALKDYAEAIKDLTSELGISKLSIYGTATGAQLAIRFGIEYPELVNHLYLDNCAHFTEEERSSILKDYFPDLSPKEDGSHVVQTWDIVSNLFKYFPWCYQTEEYKINGAAPPIAVLQSTTIEYLKAGKDYDLAYKAAFSHERVDNIQALTVPTTILRWEASILKKYTDRLFEYDLPDCIGQVAVPAQDRYETISKIIKTDATDGMDSESQDYSEANLQPIALENNINGTFENKPPSPSEEGFHLVRAWHELRDQALFAQKEDESLAHTDPNVLQDQLISWYSHNY